MLQHHSALTTALLPSINGYLYSFHHCEPLIIHQPSLAMHTLSKTHVSQCWPQVLDPVTECKNPCRSRQPASCVSQLGTATGQLGVAPTCSRSKTKDRCLMMSSDSWFPISAGSGTTLGVKWWRTRVEELITGIRGATQLITLVLSRLNGSLSNQGPTMRGSSHGVSRANMIVNFGIVGNHL